MRLKILFSLCAWLTVVIAVCLRGTSTAQDASVWGDLGNGTFANPILPADYSDVDAIRVGDAFYAISSTMQYSPGMVVLRSRDLVNWTIAGHAVNDLTQISPELSCTRMNRDGRGVWAGAIRFHGGKFWVYFGTPDEGYFMTRASDVAGPWEPLQQVLKEKGWDDCCPFWDDDGQGYLIGTHFSDGYKIHLFKMSADGKSLDRASDRVLYSSKGSEANKLYKIDGIYYHYFSEVRAEGRVPMMRRARSLEGPWETRQLAHVDRRVDKEPNQGGFVELGSGDWWFLTHQGTGDWEGRALCLLPVKWIDHWPIIGNPGDDGIGRMVWSAKKPIAGITPTIPQTNDEFNDKTLAPQWEWNYQPRDEKWSLNERPGFLRLHAFGPLKPEDLLSAGNTLTQRCWRAADCVATVKLDVSSMSDGQFAGLAHYAKTWAAIGIRHSSGERKIVRIGDGAAPDGPVLSRPSVWLRTTWGLDGIAHFSYSTDGDAFTELGGIYRLTWGHYRGDRIAIASWCNQLDGGFVDVDWFHFDCKRPAGGDNP